VLIEYTLDMPTKQASPVGANAGVTPAGPAVRGQPEDAGSPNTLFCGGYHTQFLPMETFWRARVRPLSQVGRELRQKPKVNKRKAELAKEEERLRRCIWWKSSVAMWFAQCAPQGCYDQAQNRFSETSSTHPASSDLHLPSSFLCMKQKRNGWRVIKP
jgi:hypothetical protein